MVIRQPIPNAAVLVVAWQVADLLGSYASALLFDLRMSELSLLLSRRSVELAPAELRPRCSKVMVLVLLDLGR